MLPLFIHPSGSKGNQTIASGYLHIIAWIILYSFCKICIFCIKHLDESLSCIYNAVVKCVHFAHA